MISETSSFTIKLNGNWTLSEFESFLKSLNNIYRALYVCKDTSQIYYKIERGEFVYPHHPFFDEYFHYLKRTIKKDKAIPYIFPYPYYDRKQENLFESIENDTYRIKRKDELKLKKIHIESPGEIKIEGGSIIKEFRELIKDLTFRNNQEERMGELAILDKELDILEKLGIPKTELGKIHNYVKRNGKTLSNYKNNELIGNILNVEV